MEGQACSKFRLQLATWLLHTQRLPNRPPQLDQHHKGYRETWSQPFQHRISQIFVTCTTADQKAAVTQQLRKVTKTHSSGRLDYKHSTISRWQHSRFRHRCVHQMSIIAVQQHMQSWVRA